MSNGSDSFVRAVWTAIREIGDRKHGYVGKISRATASSPTALANVWVSGIDPQKDVPVHPTQLLDDQIRAGGAVGQDVLVLSIRGQLQGVSIQLTGETRW